MKKQTKVFGISGIVTLLVGLSVVYLTLRALFKALSTNDEWEAGF